MALLLCTTTCKSQTGISMTMGKGTLYSSSWKQKRSAKSSTEAKFYGVDDTMNQVLWTRHFLKHQGYRLRYSTILQDNQVAMWMEKNWKMSSTKNTNTF